MTALLAFFGSDLLAGVALGVALAGLAWAALSV
jgi:hypothetical protein